MKNILLSLGAGENQIPLIEEIKNKGFKCLAFDKNQFAKGFEISDYFVPISSHNYTEIIEYIEKNGFKDRVLGVLTRSTGNPVLSTAYIGKHFGLKAVDLEIAKLITDKSKLILMLNKHNIPSPKLFLSNGDIPKQVKYPVFVKPSKTNLSHKGMAVCFNDKELSLALKNAISLSENGFANVEEYLIGYDTVSIDFVINGEIVNIATIGELTKGFPHFEGVGWYFGCSDFERPVKNTFKQFVEKLNVKNGFFQTAMKTSTDFKTSKIYEIHGEIGGDFVCDYFLPKVIGEDIFSLNIDFATNSKLNLKKREHSFGVLIFENAVDFNKLKQINDRFEKENGFYFLKPESEKQLLNILNKLENSDLKISYRNS